MCLALGQELCGAKPYTEDEERSLSEIVKSFNERHGTQFTKEGFLRFEQVDRDIMTDDMTEMLHNNPPMLSTRRFHIVLSDAQVRDQAIRHFFGQALREVRDARSVGP